MKQKLILTFNALASILYMLIIFAAFFEECVTHVFPCSLCYLQRACMVGVSISLLLNVFFYIHIWHYVSALAFVFTGDQLL